MPYRGITAMINIPPIIPLFGDYIGEYPRCSSLVIVNRMIVFHSTLGFIIGCIILVHIYYYSIIDSLFSLNPFSLLSWM